MFKQSLNTNLRAVFCSLFVALIASFALAQTTQFTYQGQFNDGGSPANGQYDLEFKLFSSLTGSLQQGATVTLGNVQVTNGLFSVTLDFGAAAFPGTNRFLEIGVRPGTSTGAYTTLTPRQQLTSTPYSIRSLGAAQADGLSLACVNCVTSSQIGSLPTGSNSYIQNNPVSQQANSSFNISGNGLIGGNVGIGTTTPTAKLHVNGTLYTEGNTTGQFQIGVIHGVNVATGPGVSGTSAIGSGVYGSGGIGVSGSSTTGYGVEGTTSSGRAITGDASGNSSINYGVYGRSNSSQGFGLYGQNTAGGYAGYLAGKSAVKTSSSGSVPSNYAGANAALSVVHPAGEWGVAITRAANDTLHANLLLYKTRNADASIPTALQLDDKIGRIVWQGPDWQNTVRNWATIDTIVRSPGNSSFGITGSIRFSAAQDNASDAVMEFFGATGTLNVPVLAITGGSDLSEQFEVNQAATVGNQRSLASIQSGMVVSIDPANPGELVLSSQAYDRKVAGIISGAGGVKTGMMMGQTGSIADGKHPVALTGRVYCWVDASSGPVNPGDLLTTSSTPGYAMKVVDHQQAQGAIIGKAMTALQQGKGLVLVLVTLQ